MICDSKYVSVDLKLGCTAPYAKNGRSREVMRGKGAAGKSEPTKGVGGSFFRY